jgi:hypothetical protein
MIKCMIIAINGYSFKNYYITINIHPIPPRIKKSVVPIGMIEIYIRLPLGNIPSKAPSYVVVATRGALRSVQYAAAFDCASALYTPYK